MTDYNDGKWHGWNGGKCPVNPKSNVEIVTRNGGFNADDAETFYWHRPDSYGNPIVAFRVIKQYKEPREFWISHIGGLVFNQFEHRPETAYGMPLIHVREVLE